MLLPCPILPQRQPVKTFARHISYLGFSATAATLDLLQVRSHGSFKHMPEEAKLQGGDLFIVDNGDQDWKVRRYLQDWTEIAHSFDIATGYFEIGALLSLDGQWQKLDHVRILMGDEVSKRTKKEPCSPESRRSRRKLDDQH